MATIKNIIKKIVPEKIVKALRPLFIRPVFDRPSMLEIGFFDGFDIAYRKGTADEFVLKDSFSHDIFFPGVPEYHLEDNHVIIDVGAHIGTFSLLASSKAKRGKVYAIEACRDTFNLLRINVALNRLANVSVHHLAITDQNGECTLYWDNRNWGNTVVKALSSVSEKVTARTLTSFLDEHQIEKCHFMKLNCEGAEYPILLNTPRNTLQRFDTILVLYHLDLWKKNTEADLIAHFQKCGFRSTIRNNTAKGGWLVATKVV